MVVARSAKEVFDYVPVCDRDLPPDQQTVFHLRRFTARLALRVQDLSAARGQVGEVVLRAGIAGWSNFHDAEGNDIVAKHKKGRELINGAQVDNPLTEESLDWLSPELLGELASAIITGNTVNADDLKN